MATPGRTPSSSATSSGTALPLPAEYARLNTSSDGTIGILKFVDDNYQKTGRVPDGFVVKNGHAVQPEPGWLLRNPWAFPAIGIATGLTFGAAAGTLGGAGGGGSALLSDVGLEAAAGMSGGTAGSTGLSMAGLGYADILKHVVPTAADFVSGIYQRKDSNAQYAEQQRLLEIALAYQKEQDAFNRQRQATLDEQERSRYGYTTGQDAARYGDTQAMWGANFDESNNRYGYEADREVSRYGDYSKRIAPYLASGASANDRMASLLGLPAGAPFDPTLTPGPVRKVTPRPTLSNPGTGYGGGPAPSQRVALDPATAAAVDAELRTLNSSDDAAYWKEKLAAHGDSLTKNWQYWKDFMGRGDGVNKGYKGAA